MKAISNAISISIIAIILTAALAVIAPVTRYTQHEIAALHAHATTQRASTSA